MGGLLHLVQRGGNWAGCGPAQSPPRCTKCNISTHVPTSYHSMWQYNCLCTLTGCQSPVVSVYRHSRDPVYASTEISCHLRPRDPGGMVLGRSLWAQVRKLAIPEFFFRFALMITSVHAVYLVPMRTTGAGCSLKVCQERPLVLPPT